MSEIDTIHQNFVDELYDFIVDWRTASFVEVCRKFGGRFPDARKVSMSDDTDPNIILWSQIPEPIVDALVQLQVERRMEFRTASPLSYYIDGGAMGLPLVKRPPKQGYKKPHWLPVYLKALG
jgi:hypothetical protein